MFLIKEAREMAGMTQEQLAKQVDVTKEYISYIENHHRNPSLNLLKKIANVLDTSVKDLMKDDASGKAYFISNG